MDMIFFKREFRRKSGWQEIGDLQLRMTYCTTSGAAKKCVREGPVNDVVGHWRRLETGSSFRFRNIIRNMVFMRKYSHKKFSGKFGEIRAKILRTPKYLPAPTPMCWNVTQSELFLEESVVYYTSVCLFFQSVWRVLWVCGQG